VVTLRACIQGTFDRNICCDAGCSLYCSCHLHLPTRTVEPGYNDAGSSCDNNYKFRLLNPYKTKEEEAEERRSMGFSERLCSD
jgi:hypothetical protein